MYEVDPASCRTRYAVVSRTSVRAIECVKHFTLSLLRRQKLCISLLRLYGHRCGQLKEHGIVYHLGGSLTAERAQLGRSKLRLEWPEHFPAQLVCCKLASYDCEDSVPIPMDLELRLQTPPASNITQGSLWVEIREQQPLRTRGSWATRCPPDLGIPPTAACSFLAKLAFVWVKT